MVSKMDPEDVVEDLYDSQNQCRMLVATEVVSLRQQLVGHLPQPQVVDSPY